MWGRRERQKVISKISFESNFSLVLLRHNRESLGGWLSSDGLSPIFHGFHQEPPRQNFTGWCLDEPLNRRWIVESKARPPRVLFKWVYRCSTVARCTVHAFHCRTIYIFRVFVHAKPFLRQRTDNCASRADANRLLFP